jgi:lysophospholipase L1-like esterase
MENPVPKAVSRALPVCEARKRLTVGMVTLAIFAMLPQTATADTFGKIGLIGDSMMVGTNSDQMCGAGGELPKCFDSKFGQHDLAWSHGGGEQAWSIARRLGYGPSQVINAGDDGEQWKDALDQAQRITAVADVDAVFINMGANDVCEKSGHDYTGDLAEIEQHIDDTLLHLVTYLTPGSKVYWSGILDIVRFRDVMVNRRHNYMFRSCQALWDLDSDEVTEEAAQSICKDEGFPDGVCDTLADWAWARDRIIDELLDYYLDKYDVREGPCGRVLDSANTPLERDEARRFNEALNALFAKKAAEYNKEQDGVEIIFTNVLYDVSIQPHYVSRLDCYHPNRAGQMKLAQELWKGFDPAQKSTFAFWFDEFDDQDWCTQEFASPWASCWYDYGDPGFEIRVDGSGWLRVQKNTGRHRRRHVVRHVGDLSDMTRAWMSFNHKRENLDDGGDRVTFKVHKDGIWHSVDRFKGSANDVGQHAGRYYDLRPFLSSDLRIMFETENQKSMKDGDRVKFDNINIFAWDDGGALDENKLVEAGRTATAVFHRWHSLPTLVDLPDPTAALAAMETFNGGDPAGVRIKNLDVTGFEVRIEEEQSLDAETQHVAESVAYAVFAPGLITDTFGKVIGEAGIATRKQDSGGSWYTVNLQGAYANPVVLMNMITANSDQASHIRLRPRSSRSFDYQIEEWDYLDQSHVSEVIAFLVLEGGVHELAGGKRIEAGTVEADHQWKDIVFAASFNSSPITLSQCQTYRGGQAVVTRQRRGSRDGLQVRLQEEEGNDGTHMTETVGYVAIEP